MPELPEAETIRRGLLKYLPGKTVKSVCVKLGRLLINDSAEGAEAKLAGQSFTDVRRIGKIVIIDFEKHSVLVRLGMTGQLIFKNAASDDADKHTHIIISNTDGTSLCYRDIRTFGRWYIYGREEVGTCPEISALGPDPFGEDYTLEALSTNLLKTSRPIKTALLDQAVVCGLGNIYADEVLFASGISPLRSAKSLSAEEAKAVFDNIKPILQSSIDNRGTTFSDYRDADGNKGSNVSRLKVYGRAGQACCVCGRPLSKVSIGGRTSVWCTGCQK